MCVDEGATSQPVSRQDLQVDMFTTRFLSHARTSDRHEAPADRIAENNN